MVVVAMEAAMILTGESQVTLFANEVSRATEGASP